MALKSCEMIFELEKASKSLYSRLGTACQLVLNTKNSILTIFFFGFLVIELSMLHEENGSVLKSKTSGSRSSGKHIQKSLVKIEMVTETSQDGDLLASIWICSKSMKSN